MHAMTPPPDSRGYLFGKRLLDLGIALALLVPMAPLMLVFLPWLRAGAEARTFVGRGGRMMQLHAFKLPQWLLEFSGGWLGVIEHLPRILPLLDGRLSR